MPGEGRSQFGVEIVRREGGGITGVVGPCAPGEDLEECEVRGIFWRCGLEGLDVGGLEQLGEDVCVGGGGGLRD